MAEPSLLQTILGSPLKGFAIRNIDTGKRTELTGLNLRNILGIPESKEEAALIGGASVLGPLGVGAVRGARGLKKFFARTPGGLIETSAPRDIKPFNVGPSHADRSLSEPSIRTHSKHEEAAVILQNFDTVRNTFRMNPVVSAVHSAGMAASMSGNIHQFIRSLNRSKQLQSSLESGGSEAGKALQDMVQDMIARGIPTTQRNIQRAVESTRQGFHVLAFHGTTGAFPRFRPSETTFGSHFGTARAAAERINATPPTTYMPDKKNIQPVLLRINAPMEMTDVNFYGNRSIIGEMVDRKHISDIRGTQLRQKVISRMINKNNELVDEAFSKVDSDLSKTWYNENYIGHAQKKHLLLHGSEEKVRLTAPQEFQAKVNKAGYDVVEKEIKSMGFDSIVYLNGSEDAGTLSYIIFNPDQVRNVNAAFSPTQRYSGDTLSSILGAGAATAGALSLGDRNEPR